MSIRLAGSVCLVLWSAVAHAGARALDNPEPSSQFRTSSTLVLVPVTVTDRRGATVNGLKSDAFSVFEDRTPQQIIAFSEQDEPCSVGLVLDVSGSMKDTLTDAKRVVRSLLDQTGDGDEALLLTVSDRPNLRAGFTSEFGGVLDRASAAKAGGNTALIDTIRVGVERMRRAHNGRRALIVISDGMDNHSRESRGELFAAALEADIQIYTIAVHDPPRHLKAIQVREEERGLLFLDELAHRTGGLSFEVRSQSDIDSAVLNIGRALRNQYVLGYQPASQDRSGKWHAIKVKLNLPDARVHARNGYYAR